MDFNQGTAVTKRKKGNITVLLFIILAVRYVIAYNEAFRANQVLWLGISGLAAVIMLYKIMQRKAMIQMSYFVWWAIAVYAYFCLSILWSLNKEFSNVMQSLALIYLMGILLSFIVVSLDDLKRLILANYLAIFVDAIYVLTTVDRELLGEQRIGSQMEGIGNSNSISQMAVFGILIAVYYLDSVKSRWWKLVNLGIFFTLGYLIMYCGSRTGLLNALSGVLLYWIIRAKGLKKIRAILIGAIVVVLLYNLIMNNEAIYTVLGSRLENMFDLLSGKGTQESSINLHYIMLVYGWEWFLARPVFGYGVDNFKVLMNQAIHYNAFSHSNFMEMLVCGGIVGFLIYNSIFVYLLVKLWTPAVKQKDKLAMFLFAMTVTLFFAQVNSIGYYATRLNTMLLIANIYITFSGREKSHG